MTTSITIANNGPLDVEIEAPGPAKILLKPGEFTRSAICLWRDASITIREVPPTPQGATATT